MTKHDVKCTYVGCATSSSKNTLCQGLIHIVKVKWVESSSERLGKDCCCYLHFIAYNLEGIFYTRVNKTSNFVKYLKSVIILLFQDFKRFTFLLSVLLVM